MADEWKSREFRFFMMFSQQDGTGVPPGADVENVDRVWLGTRMDAALVAPTLKGPEAIRQSAILRVHAERQNAVQRVWCICPGRVRRSKRFHPVTDGSCWLERIHEQNDSVFRRFPVVFGILGPGGQLAALARGGGEWCFHDGKAADSLESEEERQMESGRAWSGIEFAGDLGGSGLCHDRGGVAREQGAAV